MNLLQLLLLLSTLMIICSGRYRNQDSELQSFKFTCRKAVYRRNSRHLRRLSRHYDWEVDEHGALRPIINSTKVRTQKSFQVQT